MFAIHLDSVSTRRDEKVDERILFLWNWEKDVAALATPPVEHHCTNNEHA